MLARDCVDIGRKLGPHNVEEQLIVLGGLHSHVLLLPLRDPGCSFEIGGVLASAEVNGLKLVQCLMLCLSITVQLRANVDELLDFLLVFDGKEWTILELLHLFLLEISDPIFDQLDLDVFPYKICPSFSIQMVVGLIGLFRCCLNCDAEIMSALLYVQLHFRDLLFDAFNLILVHCFLCFKLLFHQTICITVSPDTLMVGRAFVHEGKCPNILLFLLFIVLWLSALTRAIQLLNFSALPHKRVIGTASIDLC